MKKYILFGVILAFVMSGCLLAPVKPDPCPECPPVIECPPEVECPDFEELLEQQPGYWLHITAPDPEPEVPWWMEGDDSGSEHGPSSASGSSDSDDDDTNEHGHGHHGGHGHGHNR